LFCVIKVEKEIGKIQEQTNPKIKRGNIKNNLVKRNYLVK
jgi:hypothetical protein